jgi:hypothetical protein
VGCSTCHGRQREPPSRRARPSLGYFITVRTYGTWLTGDRRGSVDDEHRSYGEPFKQRDDFRAGYQARQMKARPLLITPPMRRII